VQGLVAGAGQGLAALDLAEIEGAAHQPPGRRQQGRRAARPPHQGIEIDQGVAPARPLGRSPLVRGSDAGVERVAQALAPGLGYGAAQQQIAVAIEGDGLLRRQRLDLGGRQGGGHRRL
jgi:hypothetical protein